MNQSNNWYSVRVALTIFIVLASLFLLAGTIYAFKAIRYVGSAPTTSTINVTGHGETFVVPDVAEVTYSVQKTATTVADAQNQVSTITANILAAVKNLGVDDKDIQTTDYSVQPKYSYPNCPTNSYCPNTNGTIVGYTVSESFQVKIHDLTKASDVLSKLGTLGVTNLSGLTFDVNDPNAPQMTARAQAISNAKAAADALAKQLGVHLVAITSFSDTSSGGPRPIYYDKAVIGMGAASAPVAPTISAGQNKITSDVTITYQVQ